MKTKFPLLIASATLLMSCGSTIVVSSSQPGASSDVPASSNAPETSEPTPQEISSMENEVSSIVNEVVHGQTASFDITMEEGGIAFAMKNVARGATREEDELVDNYININAKDLSLSGSFGGNFDAIEDATFLSHASGKVDGKHYLNVQNKDEKTVLDEDGSVISEEVSYDPKVYSSELKETEFALDFGMADGKVYGDFSDRGIRSLADYALDLAWSSAGLGSGYKTIVSLLLKGIMADPFKADLKAISDHYEEEIDAELTSEGKSIIDEIGGIDLELSIDDVIDYFLDYLNDEAGINKTDDGYNYAIDFDKADASAFISDILESLPFDELTPELISQIAANLTLPSFEASVNIKSGHIDFDYNIDFTAHLAGSNNPLLDDYALKAGESKGEISLGVKAKGNIKITADPEGELPVVPLDDPNVYDVTDDIISIIDTIREAAEANEEEPQ